MSASPRDGLDRRHRIVTGADPVGVPEIGQVADRLAISDVLDAYAQAIDTRDHDLLRRVFTDDATLDYSEVGGPDGTAAEVLAWLRDSLAQVGPGQHVITNRRIVMDSVDDGAVDDGAVDGAVGDTARCNSYLFNPLALYDGRGDHVLLMLGGSYDDRLRRTPDGWRISDRVHHVAWTFVRTDPTILAPDPNEA